MLSLVTLVILVLQEHTTPSQAACVENGPSVGEAVNTTSGTIIGHASSQYPKVSEYLGIPYAEPPINHLRFAPPEPFTSSDEIQADALPLSCTQDGWAVDPEQPENIQHMEAANAQWANNTSEDCLYLNVWTKSSSCEETCKPVLVWFYGGGFHSGSAANMREQGAIFAQQADVVIVNFNYRLGIFGFPGAPNLEQNVGLLDQRLVIEWVRNNIEAFGGDPSRITIFGHSAGAASVDMYTYAWMDDPIIAGASPMSCTATSFAQREAPTTANGWYNTSSLLGCGNASDHEGLLLKCMQSKTTTEVFAASENATAIVRNDLGTFGKLYSSFTGIFGPTIDNKTVFSNPTKRGKAGLFAKVPILAGGNSDEACAFVQDGRLPPLIAPVVNDMVFTCPATFATHWRASAGIPAYQYRYYAGYPNLEYPACPGKPWHGQDVYVMYNASASATRQAATKDEVHLGRYMRKALAAFAHDPANGLAEEKGWPTVSDNKNQVVALGRDGKKFSLKDTTLKNTHCELLYSHGAPTF